MHASTRQQLDHLDADPARPLLICDVDEVVVHFLKGLEVFLDERGLWLDAASFALNGNIRRKEDNVPLPGMDLGNLLMDFFAARTRHLEAIEGAAPALAALAGAAEIVMLTNLPDAFRADRIANLADHGIDFPVITNEGPKGPAIATLAEGRRGPVVFIDDNHGYLASAREHSPDTHLVHFLQDHRFARHVEPCADFSLRTDNWAEAEAHMLALLA